MRTGKIAKLSSDLREELNQHLEDGQDGGILLRWLNELPEVRTMLKECFDGAPINKQNLSDWRQGGFREWQIHEELISHALQLSDGSSYLEEVVDMPLLAGNLVAVVAAHYAALLNTWDGEPDPKFEAKLRLLRGLARDIALIQKTIHQATLQKNEFKQKQEDDFNKAKDEMKKEVLAPILAKFKIPSLARLFGGGKSGEDLAEFVTAVRDDLPLPESTNENPKTVPPSAALAKEEASAKEDLSRRSFRAKAEASAKEEASAKAGLPRRSFRAKAEASAKEEASAKAGLPRRSLGEGGSSLVKPPLTTPPPQPDGPLEVSVQK